MNFWTFSADGEVEALATSFLCAQNTGTSQLKAGLQDGRKKCFNVPTDRREFDDSICIGAKPWRAGDDDMNVFDAIKSRRSIRSFKDKPIEEEKLLRVLEAGRLAAEINVLVESSQTDFIGTTIKYFSKDYDLVFLGMRPPNQDESAQEYAAYYEQLMKQTEKYPPAALVLAGEEIKFSDIFR